MRLLPKQGYHSGSLALQRWSSKLITSAARRDSDVLETDELSEAVRERMLALGGKDTALAKKHRVYVDIVAPGLPFLPQVPRWNNLSDLNARLTTFELYALDVVDVVVAKLKRFSRNDQNDIEAMIEKNLVVHSLLVDRFRDAANMYAMDARASELHKYVRNLHQVERDILLIEETDIEIPPWA